MALEGTHMRFALDIRDKLGVGDIDAYVSGSVYPDSRYITGIDRFATHPLDYRTDPMFQKTDFNKGWFAHLLCDDIQQSVVYTVLPHITEGDKNETWIQRTAIKILQDISRSDSAPRSSPRIARSWVILRNCTAS